MTSRGQPTPYNVRMDPKRGKALDTYPGVGIPGRPWGHHTAAELKDGRVVDVDRGLVFDSREDLSDA